MFTDFIKPSLMAAGVIVAGLTFPSVGHAQQTEKEKDPPALPDIVVFGSAQELEEVAEEVKRQVGSVALVRPRELRRTRQANLKDVLKFVPGVYIAPRFGAADEAQISIRGSGLRNNYHARGVNLLVNGMPYRNSDGFTDFESLEMMSVDAITVYKGGNAFRYGGATLGGAINMQTRTGYSSPGFELTGQGGSNGFFKGQLSSGGTTGRLDWYGAYARTSLDGYREYSAQGRDRFNGHLGYVLSPKTDIRGFYIFARVREELPGALTPENAALDPTLAFASNRDNRWGRDYDLHHIGIQMRSQLSRSLRLEVSPFYQYRDIDHPIFQVINQQSKDMGVEARLESTAQIAGRNNRFSFGVLPSRMRMDNQRYENIVGEHGELTKEQEDVAGGISVYAEDAFEVSDGVTVLAGLRYEKQKRKSTDKFLSDGDQSADIDFEAYLPRVGLLLEVAPTVRLYGNISNSYEPPILGELNSLTVPGFVDVKAQEATQYEVGTRGNKGALVWDVAYYHAKLDNEILNLSVAPFPGAPFTVPTFRNAAKTKHSGIEAGVGYATETNLLATGDVVAMQGSFTLNRFSFVEDSLFTGNELPGLPSEVFQGELRYIHPSGLSLTPSIEWVPGSYFVNSANTESNEGWTSLGFRAEYSHPITGFTVFVSGDNLTDSRHSASVQVDNDQGRWFEPVDGRSFYAGFRWSR